MHQKMCPCPTQRIQALLKAEKAWRPSHDPYRSMYKYDQAVSSNEMETLKPE